MRRAIGVGAPACMAALAVGAVAAAAATYPGDSPERVAYVSRLEPICAPGSKATQRALKGVRRRVRADKLKRAAAQFARATRIFSRTRRKLAAVPRPDPDRKALREWFKELKLQEVYLRKIVRALHAGQKVRSQGYLARFVHHGNLANNAVLSFGFHACKFDPTKYG